MFSKTDGDICGVYSLFSSLSEWSVITVISCTDFIKKLSEFLLMLFISFLKITHLTGFPSSGSQQGKGEVILNRNIENVLHFEFVLKLTKRKWHAYLVIISCRYDKNASHNLSKLILAFVLQVILSRW